MPPDLPESLGSGYAGLGIRVFIIVSFAPFIRDGGGFQFIPARDDFPEFERFPAARAVGPAFAKTTAYRPAAGEITVSAHTSLYAKGGLR
jgi:hypothetical protein